MSDIDVTPLEILRARSFDRETCMSVGGSFLVRYRGDTFAAYHLAAALRLAHLEPSADGLTEVEFGWTPEEDVGAARLAGSAIGWFGKGEIGCELPIGGAS